MFNMIIVDDEERARVGIRTLIDWQAHGISIVAEARDGQEALEILSSHPVDIMLTDIRMPQMDGLELISAVSAKYPHIKSVIMSGYDDFAYAQKAIRVGASNYLLKPSRRQEILNTILAITEQIRSEKLEITSLEHLRQGFRESLPLLKEKTLSQLILTESSSYSRLLANLKMNNLVFPYMMYGVILLRIDNFQQLHQKYLHEDTELLKYGLKNICEESLPESIVCTAFEHQDDIVLVLNTDDLLDHEELSGYIRIIQDNIASYLKFTVSAGIGSLDHNIQHLRRSFLEASQALNTRNYTGTGKIVEFSGEFDDESSQSSYPLHEEQEVLKAVRSGSSEEITEMLSLFNVALQPETVSRDQVIKSSFALFFALYKLCIENNVNVNKVFGQNLTELIHVLSRSSLDNIFQSLLETALRVSEHLSSKKNSNKLLESAKLYIEQNYMKDINREIVAREIYITPGYLSLLFKQQLKISFTDYLHKVRIERACLLFKDPGMRIEDIALQSGYNDTKYFYQVFKKYKGITPNQFRSNAE
ncbi:response regulator [Paenibacillus sp. MMS20-IR301]|uniref:response regulator n=1 Tax=Paenibacillus sp. MMS20-IR301 TaxID=2895946 RepID=UPI0028E43EAE|nr:response regulator [Paenibacillus sp. MMS20-IR301]WNS44151.1 response regulator [Paenibacillus sp. MMS20-IR301]